MTQQGQKVPIGETLPSPVQLGPGRLVSAWWEESQEGEAAIMSSRASPRARRMVHLHVVSDLGISIDAGIPPRSANHSPRPSPRGLVWRASGPRSEQPSCPARGRRGRASRRVARPSLTVTMRTWSCLAGSLTRRCPYPYPHVLVFWVCVCVFNFLKIKFNFLKNFFFKLSFFFFPEWVQIPREVEITPRGPPHVTPSSPHH